MTPDQAARLVIRWVRHYTRRLPGPVAGRRLEEISADLHDHIADERLRGASERRIALAVLSRMLRGSAADVRWRAGNRPERGTMKLFAVVFVMVAVGAAAMVYGERDDAPGLVLIGLLLAAAAVAWGIRAAYRRRGRAGTSGG